MTHLDIIKEAYDKVGIVYVVKERGEYQYLFRTGEYKKQEFEDTSCDILIRQNDFIEFHNGSIVSY